MRVGYCVPVLPQLASFRLRVAIPAAHLGCPYRIGAPGDVSFFFKDGDPDTAAALQNVVYDVVNDHFDTKPSYREMCDLAATVTCASVAMQETIYAKTRRSAAVIDDPYENTEQKAAVTGDDVLWFGHSANLSSLFVHDIPYRLLVCTNRPGSVWWTPESERESLRDCGAVILTSNNPGASSNRVVKAIRAGRFVVAPHGVESWEQFEPYMWLGDPKEGLEWAFNNREEACKRIAAGQEYVRTKFSPQSIGSQWAVLFASTLGQAISRKQAGSA